MINPIFEIDNILYDEVFLIWQRGSFVPRDIQFELYGCFRPTLRYNDRLLFFVDTRQDAESFISSHKDHYFTVVRSMRNLNSI